MVNVLPVTDNPERISSVRCDESLELLRAVDRLAGGQGGVIELIGCPGSGKSRLLGPMTAAARSRGITVLDGRCSPTERQYPLAVFTRALAGVMTPERLAELSPGHASLLRAALCAQLGPDARRPEPLGVSQAVRALLERSARDGGGLLLVLDDFHWADPQSLELADHLVRLTAPAPVLLVIVHRPRQAHAPLLGTLAQGVESGQVERIELGALTLCQAASLLGVPTDTGWLPAVYHESQGNPLCLLVLGETAPLSPLLGTRLLTGRLAPLAAELALLDPAERLVAESGAVLGDRFSWEELSAVSELPAPELTTIVTELIDVDVLRPLRGSTSLLTFRHTVLRRMLHDQADHCWRARAHRRALTVLSRRTTSAAERAIHIELSASSFTREDLEILAKAGEEAVPSSPVDAARWLLLALKGLPPNGDSPGRLLGLIPPLAKALRAAEYGCKNDTLQHLLTQGTPLQPTESYRSAVRLCALVDCLHGRYEAADALLAGELTALTASKVPNGDLLARFTVYRGIVALLGQHRNLPRLAAEALLLARTDGHPTTLAGALVLHALAELGEGRTKSCLASYDAAVRQMDELPTAEAYLHTEFLALLGWCAFALGRPREAESFYERGVELTSDCSHNAMLPVLLSGLAETQLVQGRPASARRSAARAADLAAYLNADQLRTHALAQEALCVTYAEPPGSSRASALAEEALRALRPGPGSWYGSAVLTLAETMLTQGSPERCLSLLVELDSPAVTGLSVMNRARYHELLTRAATAAGVEGGAHWAETAECTARLFGTPHTSAYAAMARGHFLLREDRAGEAVAAYREAERLFDGSHLRLPQLTARLRAARALAAAGRPDRARALAERMNALAEQWGVLLYARTSPDHTFEGTLDRGCHALMPTPAPPAADDLALLTQRELEVARLAGTGQRTREIAEALQVSPRTVEVHLSRIYRKLEVGSRAELARLMAVRISPDAVK
ncbi:AAA family ATPase [Kitasatospora sp. NPDC001095]